mmetsp:Transcript_65427/g.106044  ORF Transcript_65427/g.106044 Transcript_65427/m.106044 type:complete len:201 (+) Transcript_65427:2-604(+)
MVAVTIEGLGAGKLWPAGPRRPRLQAGTDCGGSRGGIWGVVVADSGLRLFSHPSRDEGRCPVDIWLGRRLRTRPQRPHHQAGADAHRGAALWQRQDCLYCRRAHALNSGNRERRPLHLGLCIKPRARRRGGKVGAHAYRPKPAAGRARWALPRSATYARPRLCYGHSFLAWQLRCANSRGSRRQQPEEVAAAARQDAGCC